jgi:hypothetical protein
MWTGEGTPVAIGLPFIQPTIGPEALDYAQLGRSACAVADIANQMIVWAVPELQQTRNTLVLPYSYRMQRWASDAWTPFDVASLAVVADATTGQPWVYLGGYSGQLFKWWSGTNDGVASGTASGTVTSATATTLVDTSATFDTTGGGLVERIVYAIGADGTVQRRRITANTATTLTVTPAWAATPNSTATYVVGVPHFELDTLWFAGGNVFIKKRWEFAYLQARSAGSVPITIALYNNYAESPFKTATLTLPSAGGVFDTAVFDVDKFGTITNTTATRVRCGKTGRVLKVRLSCLVPNSPLIVMALGVRMEVLTDKIL